MMTLSRVTITAQTAILAAAFVLGTFGLTFVVVASNSVISTRLSNIAMADRNAKASELRVSSKIVDMQNDGNGCFVITYRYTIKNNTNKEITDIKSWSNLERSFSPNKYEVISLTSDKLATNNGYNGKGDVQLLNKGGKLAAGQSVNITLKVKLCPTAGHNGPFKNYVDASGRIPGPKDNNNGNGGNGSNNGGSNNGNNNGGSNNNGGNNGGNNNGSGNGNGNNNGVGNGNGNNNTPGNGNGNGGNNGSGNNNGGNSGGSNNGGSNGNTGNGNSGGSNSSAGSGAETEFNLPGTQPNNEDSGDNKGLGNDDNQNNGPIAQAPKQTGLQTTPVPSNNSLARTGFDLGAFGAGQLIAFASLVVVGLIYGVDIANKYRKV